MVGAAMHRQNNAGQAWAAVLAVCSLVSVPQWVAAEQVGTAVVNGRVVILDSNGTWKYQDAPEPDGTATGCETAGGVQVCVKAAGWRETRKQADFHLMYALGNRFYLGIIAEPYGIKDGLTYEGLQAAIVGNAASGAGTTEEKIPVLGTDAEVNGVKGLRSITYSATISGTPFVFHNVYRVYQDKSIQCVFWGIGKEMSGEFTAAINGALPHIKFD